MSELKYKTRGMANPKGKPRIFFMCFSQDFEKYFEVISEEILAKQDVSIWYKEPRENEDDKEDYFSYLSQMQLFVMPVTENLLKQKNSVIEEEFPFAIENHIPVLPFMEEEGLEELFNEKCGDLHFLDRHSVDKTGISYEEKLTNYLKAILIGDELAEKIRAAFDAYIFLSYRKKDRRYAQELMRLIHKSEVCRNIAIWYDEFLVPGENFTDAIKDALNKSDLFALVVTPNLVNEENYVMNVEYPMAMESGKPIVPVQFIDTDRGLLEDRYANMPSCVNAEEAEVADAFITQAERMAFSKNDSPEHTFFIGLAYLGGIDVEVDYARAVELITDAAESGLLEAIEKLVIMYNEGEGVPRNRQMAIKWQERVVQERKNLWTKSKSIPDKACWVKEIQQLGDFLQETGQIKEAKKMYLEVDRYLGDLEKAGMDWAPRNLSILQEKLADVCEKEGQYVEAKKYILRNAKMCEKLLAMAKGTAQIRQARADLLCSYQRLGDLHLKEGKVIETRKYFEKALDLAEGLLEKADNPSMAQRDLAVCVQRLANVYVKEEKFAEAEKYRKKEMELCEKLYEEVRTDLVYRDMFVAYHGYAVLKQRTGQYAEAEAYAVKAAKIGKELHKKINSVQTGIDLAKTQTVLGEIYKAENQLDKARKAYMESIKGFEKLVKKIEQYDLKESLCQVYMSLADMLERNGKFDEAKPYCMKMVKLREELVLVQKDAEAYNKLALSYFYVAFCDADQNYYRKAYEVYVKLCKDYPKSEYFKKNRDFIKKKLET